MLNYSLQFSVNRVKFRMWIGICFFYLLPLIHESISLSDINKPQPSAKIVGGQNAPNHYPFVLSLQYNKITPSFLFMPGKNWSHFCGATIVRENFFVTVSNVLVYDAMKLVSLFDRLHIVFRIRQYQSYQSLLAPQI